ncbi:hypothetical protein CAPTEDRAFT_201642 [Capitella teleta]|uniref:Uncharacterized protein n=1 Tax=Capitella teleta TaxID=283909 RepID=R7VG32_CAPTE|nr:hypothetical protein CAPTEDRAFT_201642 [Capitella teleta]|eukprot:ELU15251.1 hypothetical protein CAPTEDRAFT_201642 [Capitella teleta]
MKSSASLTGQLWASCLFTLWPMSERSIKAGGVDGSYRQDDCAGRGAGNIVRGKLVNCDLNQKNIEPTGFNRLNRVKARIFFECVFASASHSPHSCKSSTESQSSPPEKVTEVMKCLRTNSRSCTTKPGHAKMATPVRRRGAPLGRPCKSSLAEKRDTPTNVRHALPPLRKVAAHNLSLCVAKNQTLGKTHSAK